MANLLLESGDALLLESGDNLLLEMEFIDASAVLSGAGALAAEARLSALVAGRIVRDRRPENPRASRQAALGLARRHRTLCTDPKRDILYGAQDTPSRPLTRRETIAFALQNRKICQPLVWGPSARVTLAGAGGLSATGETLLYYDDFDRGAASTLGTATCGHDWIECINTGIGYPFRTQGGTYLGCYSVQGGPMMSTLDVPSDMDAQWCEMTYSLHALTPTGLVASGPAVRCNGATWNSGECYALLYRLDNGGGFSGFRLVRLYPVGGGMAQTIIHDESGSLSEGDRLRLAIDAGTNMTVTKNDVTLFTASDGTLATGKPGIGVNTDGGPTDFIEWLFWEAA